ncbi:phage major capsid protein [Blastococcus sp. TF02A-30]|uniref:phage major capsid protein n=1 Tax=Blastococcus sp. TF02A-30 TaxID=2250580 RepID=UPI000DEB7F7C|nr:phage major capsid protein [Blastococcus sp. TF02A-30]RBY92953.1 phage major capsid protein [Blastococcus sp. TF02A-30]
MTITYARLQNSNDHDLRTLGDKLIEARKVVREVRDAHWATMSRINDAAQAAGRDLTKAQRADYDTAERALDEATRIGQKIDDELFMRTQREGITGGGFLVDHEGRRTGLEGGTSEYRDGDPLTDRQTFAGFVRSRGLAREEESEGLSLQKYLRGALFGEWRGAEAERRAMSGLAAANGQVLIPTVLAASVIDLARAESRVLQAGARLVPMANRQLDVARWVKDPEPQWRGETEAIAEDDATMDKVTLEARSLAVVTKITRELVEDTNIEAELRRALALSFALKIDHAALYGAGDDEPTGLVNTTGVVTTDVAANGGPPSWDVLVDSVGRVRDVNESPTAQIMADRTARSLAKLRAEPDGAYLPAPQYLDGVRRLTTSQVPVNLATGTSVDTSDVITGDFSQLLIGVRTALTMSVLQERYMVEEGSFGLVGWYRGDVAVARPKAFDIVRGVRP